MFKLSIALLLAALMLFSGFGTIHSQMENMEIIHGSDTEESSGDCGTILASVQMSQKQLDKLDDTVQSITPNLKDIIELRFLKLVEKLEHFIESKFVEVDKKMDRMESKLTTIEGKISQYTPHIDSKFNSLESLLTHALNVSDTLNNKYNSCCNLSLEIAALVKNTTTKINDIYVTTLNVSARVSEINETIQNVTNLVVPNIENNISRPDGLLNKTTARAPNVPTEVKKPAPSRTCDSSQQEECCSVADIGHGEYIKYNEMSARGRHTVVNKTSAGLQEYTMYFAVRGFFVGLVLSHTSPLSNLYYKIRFTKEGGDHIYIDEFLPTHPVTSTSLNTTNVISRDQHYSYYYVTISGDTLEVGRRGEPPLLTRNSTELRKLKYFSFAEWDTPAGAALYDCSAE